MVGPEGRDGLPILMRVLMFCAHFRPVVGGAERQAEIVAQGLLRRGCDVEILTPRLRPTWPQVEEFDGLRVNRFDFPAFVTRYPRVRGLGLPNLWLMRRAVQRAVRAHLGPFDVLHTHLASTYVAFALEAAKRMGRPVICKIACGGIGFDFHELRASSILGPRLVESLVQGMDRWIAISREIETDLFNAGVSPDRIVSIPNVLATPGACVARPRDAVRRLLCMGRLSKFDLATLFGALDAAAVDCPELELRIVGRGDVGEARALLERYPQARTRTRVVGFAPSETELPAADAIVHLSLAEGIANVLLEAMAAGIPCIASDIPPNREVLGEGSAGLLVRLGDSAALATAILALARDNQLAARLASAGRARAHANYSLDVIAPRYLNLYAELSGAAGERLV